MSVYVTPGALKNHAPNGRLKMLDEQGKLNNETLFRVVNYLTGVETHVPGGAISRFITSSDYLVEEIGPNVPQAVAGATDPAQQAQEMADKIIADAQAKADEILAQARNAAQNVKKTGGAAQPAAPAEGQG